MNSFSLIADFIRVTVQIQWILAYSPTAGIGGSLVFRTWAVEFVQEQESRIVFSFSFFI